MTQKGIKSEKAKLPKLQDEIKLNRKEEFNFFI